MPRSLSDENLLLGVLALQMGFISREELTAAAGAWMLQESSSLGDVLRQRGEIDTDSQGLLEKLVQKHLEMHGNDPKRSLAAADLSSSLMDDLCRLNNGEIDATLDQVKDSGCDASEATEVLRSATRQDGLEATEMHGSSVGAEDVDATAAHQSGTRPDGVEATEMHGSNERGDDIDATEAHQPGTRDPNGPSTVALQTGEAPMAGVRYRILRPHARGGLGQVSVAIDEELHREVAFKELLADCADNSDSRDRFLLEAEITGGLEHPGIVPVYGFGTRADGRPFYAMRFIRGESLKAAIEAYHEANAAGRLPGERALEFRKLLARFVDVCHAIWYAHSRGVVHRDLKPANIMLGKFGETLVVDWGVAKSVDCPEKAADGQAVLHPVSGSSSGPTQMGSVIGTPAYMSPEQAEGRLDIVGPAADIYSLGATFQTLLTNTNPFTAGSIINVLEKVRRGDFPRPRQIDPTIPRPLEAICLKAMAMKPEDRYPTATALAEDIEHWLADEPVAAYPEPLRTRIGRWTRRHRAWTQAGAAALLLVTIVSIVAAVLIDNARQRASDLAEKNLILAQEERRSRNEALLRFREARDAVDTWLTGSSEALKYFPGVQEARKRLLEQAAEDYESFVKTRSDDVGLELERCRAYLRLGDVRKTLGETVEAEESYRTARDLIEPLVASHPDNADLHLEAANSRVKLGILLKEIGRLDDARAAYDTAGNELARLAGAYPNDPRFADALGTCLLNQGLLHTITGPREKAREAIQQSAGHFQELYRAEPSEPRFLEGLSEAENVLGQIFFESGRHDEAIVHLNEAVSNFSLLADAQPDIPRYVESLVSTRILLANVFRKLGRPNEELQSYRAAVSDCQHLTEALPDVPLYRENLAITWTDIGQLLHQLGQTSEAEDQLNAALAMFTELAATYPQFPRYYEEQAACRDNLGRVLSDLDRNQEAKAAVQSAIETYRQLSSAYPSVLQYQERLAVGCSHLGQVLHKLSDHAAAKESLDTARNILKALIDRAPEQPSYQDELATTNRNLGSLLRDSGDTAGAGEAFGRARHLWEDLIKRLPVPEYQNNLAWFLANASDPESRDPARAIELALLATEKAPENPVYLNSLATAYCRAENWQAAAEKLEDAIRLRGDGNARDWFFLAMTQAKRNQLQEAKTSFESGSRWMDENRPGNLELQRIRAEVEGLFNPRDNGSPADSDQD